jgi:hypothetical protein
MLAQHQVRMNQTAGKVQIIASTTLSDSLSYKQMEWLDLLVMEQDQGLGYVSAKRHQAQVWLHRAELFQILGLALPKEAATWILLDSVKLTSGMDLKPDFFRMRIDLAPGQAYPAKALREAQFRHSLQGPRAFNSPTPLTPALYGAQALPFIALNAFSLSGIVQPWPLWQGSGYLQSTSSILRGTFHSGMAFPLSAKEQGSAWRSLYHYWQWESPKEHASRTSLQIGHLLGHFSGTVDNPSPLYGVRISNWPVLGYHSAQALPIRGMAQPGSIVEWTSTLTQGRNSLRVEEDSTYQFWLPVHLGVNRMEMYITEAGALPRRLTRTLLIPQPMSAYKKWNYSLQLGKNPYRLSESQLSGQLSYGWHPLWNVYLTSQGYQTPEGRLLRWSGGVKTSLVNYGWMDLALEDGPYLRVNAVLQRYDRWGIQFQQYRFTTSPIGRGGRNGTLDGLPKTGELALMRSIVVHSHVGNRLSVQSQFNSEQTKDQTHQSVHLNFQSWWKKWTWSGFLQQRFHHYGENAWNRYGSLGSSLTYALNPGLYVNLDYAGNVYLPQVDHRFQLGFQWNHAGHQLIARLGYGGTGYTRQEKSNYEQTSLARAWQGSGLETVVGFRTQFKHLKLQQSLNQIGNRAHTHSHFETAWVRSLDRWEYTDQNIQQFSGIVLLAYRDLNGDGLRNQQEPLHPDLMIASAPGSIRQDPLRGQTLLTGLLPNHRYVVEWSTSMQAQGFMVRYPSIEVTSPASGMKTYEIPVDEAIELEGTWVNTSQSSLQRPEVILTHTQTGYSTRLVLMQDGGWYLPGIPLGSYQLRMAEDQANDWEIEPAYVEITQATKPFSLLLRRRTEGKVQGTEGTEGTESLR